MQPAEGKQDILISIEVTPMECENVFCVYWQEDKCSLRAISVDVLGHCRECVLVDLEDNLLAARRQEMRDAFEKMHRQWQEKSDAVCE